MSTINQLMGAHGVLTRVRRIASPLAD